VKFDGKVLRFRYRTCILRVYNSLEEAIEDPAIRRLREDKPIKERLKETKKASVKQEITLIENRKLDAPDVKSPGFLHPLRKQRD
jgi:hypothetical protein